MIEDHFQEFNAVYDERFARQWGYWRPVVARVVEKYVACGILKHGFAPSSTIAPLVAAVFRHFGAILKRRIERLELRIDVLKRRIGVLKLQIDDLGRRSIDVKRYTPMAYARMAGVGACLWRRVNPITATGAPIDVPFRQAPVDVDAHDATPLRDAPASCASVRASL
jgi:hypothetical protein